MFSLTASAIGFANIPDDGLQEHYSKCASVESEATMQSHHIQFIWQPLLIMYFHFFYAVVYYNRPEGQEKYQKEGFDHEKDFHAAERVLRDLQRRPELNAR